MENVQWYSKSSHEKAMEFYSFVYCLDRMEREDHIAFKDGMVAVQRLKYSFVYNLWSWNRVFLGEEVHSLDFLEWMVSR